jgi:hypothetical protein
MSARLSNDDLDHILAIQFSVAWAGESGGAPPRLGWWQSDLIDADAGGDLFARLLPRTKDWAGLSLARRAAARIDKDARAHLKNGDRVWTVFHLGFVIDEQLCDRVADHRRHLRKPHEVLPDVFAVGYDWSSAAFAKRMSQLGSPKSEVTTAGRRLKGRQLSAVESTRHLAAALLPLAEKYPLPFLEVPG